MPEETERKDDETESPDGIGVMRAREILGDLVLRADYGGERIVLTRHGKKVGAIVGMKDLERLNALDSAA